MIDMLLEAFFGLSTALQAVVLLGVGWSAYRLAPVGIEAPQTGEES